jgi:hypothetical protein
MIIGHKWSDTHYEEVVYIILFLFFVFYFFYFFILLFFFIFIILFYFIFIFKSGQPSSLTIPNGGEHDPQDH